MERVTRSFPATAGTNLQELAYGTACLEGEKKSLASGIGRPNGLPHHWKHTTCIGGAGGFACEPGFFHSFLGSGYANFCNLVLDSQPVAEVSPARESRRKRLLHNEESRGRY